MPLHILLCDKVPFYFMLRLGNIRSSNLNFESNRFESIKGIFIKEKVFLSPNSLSGRFPVAGPAGQAFFSHQRLAAVQLGPAATATRPGVSADA
jgi:hypothetical protein